MNNDTLTDKEAERLGRAYRAVSGERTPAELDRAVLKDAQAALTNSGRATPAGWFAPLAVAATLVLGVGVLLEMPASNPTGAADTETGSGPSGLGEQPSAPMPDARSFRKTGSTVANQARQGKVQDPASADGGNRASAEREAAEAAAENGHCDSTDTSSAASWRRCIETLNDSGKSEAAEAELSRLQERYPESQRDE